MIDADFEQAAVSWLASRGYLVTKFEPVSVDLGDGEIEAYVMAETPVNRPESLFDDFWAAYPRKTGKEAARKIFNKLDLGSQNLAMFGLRAHLDADAFSNEKCYIKHPSTWLNQKIYLEEPEKRSFRKPQIGGQTNKRKALDEFLKD